MMKTSKQPRRVPQGSMFGTLFKKNQTPFFFQERQLLTLIPRGGSPPEEGLLQWSPPSGPVCPHRTYRELKDVTVVGPVRLVIEVHPEQGWVLVEVHVSTSLLVVPSDGPDPSS